MTDDDGDRPSSQPILQVGRYVLFDEIASGGFASIHLGRTVGVGGFARTVAIKRLHRQYAKDPDVSAMFLDEAKLVARIRHPNVLPTLDLISEDDELFLVMEYVEGITLRALMREALRRKRRVPLPVVLRIMVGALQGLDAAHEAKDERGNLLQVIHRDVAPDNILIGTDGMPRLLDFGVARALGQYHSTRSGEVKGKLSYITPEQVRGDPLTRRSDIFSASTVLWEAMTGRRLFRAKTIGAIAHAVLNQPIDPPSVIADTPKKLDGIVMQGLERDADRRWASAQKMGMALEAVGELASQSAVGRYVRQAASEKLEERSKQVAMVEAYPVGALKPIPVRSSLQSSTNEDTDDGPAVLDEASMPDSMRNATPAGGVAPPDGSPSRDAPATGTLDAVPLRNRLIPVAAGAAAVALVVAVAASMGGPGPAPSSLGGAQSEPPSATPSPPEPPVSAAAKPSTSPTAPVVDLDGPGPGPRASGTSTTPSPKGKDKAKGGSGKPPPPPPGGSLYGRE